jgi:hypothetical protein
VPVGPARLPLGNPSEAQIDALMVRLDELGFAHWGAKSVLRSQKQLAFA